MKHKDYLGAPVVDEVQMTVEPIQEARILKSERLRLVEAQKARLRLEAQKKQAMQERKREQEREKRNASYNSMLKNSLKRKSEANLIAALSQKHTPFSKSAMVKNPLAGFLPAEAVKQEGASAFDPDFNIYMAVPAQEFTNQIRQKDLHYSDFPLVIDDKSKGDFSGVLLTEKGSPDYATMIVNDAKNDFGSWYDPRTWFEKTPEQKAKEAQKEAQLNDAVKAEVSKNKAFAYASYAGAAALLLVAISILKKK